MSAVVKAHIALFFVALVYGLNYIIAKDVMGSDFIRPLTFILFRVSFATVLFWIVDLLFIRQRVRKRDLPYLALCGLFGVAANQMLFFSGLDLTGPINASLIMTTTPILVFLGAYWILKERLSLRKGIGIALGLSGAVWLLSGTTKGELHAGNLGDLLVFLNASCYAVYLVLVKKMLKRYHPLLVIKWAFTFGLLYVIPFGIWQYPGTSFTSFTPLLWLGFLYVLLFTTFIVYFLNVYALRTVSPTVVGAYIYLQPILAGVAAVSLGKDQLTLPQVIAGLLIFAGIYLVSFTPRKRRKGGNPGRLPHDSKKSFAKH